MKVKGSGNTEFESPEAGTYSATCYKVVDIGTQSDEYKGKATSRRQVIIGWELEHFMQDARPFVVSGFYTASLNEKAKLRGVLESWRGQAFKAEELEHGFDLRKLLGAPCLVTVIKSDTGKTKVSTVIKIPKTMVKPEPSNPHVYFSLDEFDETVFNNLSDWTQKRIAQSPEYQRIVSGGKSQPAAQGANKETSDIPF